MSFWMAVLAVITGKVVYGILVGLGKSCYDEITEWIDRKKKKKRVIGFGEKTCKAEPDEETVSMRKIGFGENR